MSRVRWYDPNPDGPHEFRVCSSLTGDCEVIEGSAIPACWEGQTSLEGAVYGVLVRDGETSAPSAPVTVPEPGGAGVFACALLLGALWGRRRRCRGAT